METMKGPRLTRQPCYLTLLLAVSLALASGCAQIPRLDPPPAMKKVDELGSSNSFAVPVAAWPTDQWWTVYGDTQLNALIDEALKNAPDLDLAQARLRAAAARVRSASITAAAPSIVCNLRARTAARTARSRASSTAIP